MALKAGNEYKLSFIIDTVAVFGSASKGYPFPDMGYLYRNAGYTITDVTDSNTVLFQEDSANFAEENMLWDAGGLFYYMNPDIDTNPFDGIILSLSDVPTYAAEFDTTMSGWIVGDAPIELSVTLASYGFFPWQDDIVFTAGDITYTTQADDITFIRKVAGILPFDRTLLLPGTLDLYVENKQFQDSLGQPYLLDVVAYDANANGQFDLLEDDVVVGYSAMFEGVMTWKQTVFAFNFRTATSAAELPEPGDVYRVDGKRPFTGDDEFIITVTEPTEELRQAADDLDQIKVVPNPYIVTNTMEPAVRNVFLNQRRRLMFTHIPAQCEIKIFTISGYLVDEIDVNNEPSNGIDHFF
ncbi:hypothetical protein ES705_46158 [subsurface metagenome]